MLWVSSGIFAYASSRCASSFLSSQEYREERKWSAVGFCSGAISGLIAITPASGFVGSRAFRLSVLRKKYDNSLQPFILLIAAAILCGVLAGTICHFATQLKTLLDFDDALDVGSTGPSQKYFPVINFCLYRSLRPTLLEVYSAICSPLFSPKRE